MKIYRQMIEIITFLNWNIKNLRTVFKKNVRALQRRFTQADNILRHVCIWSHMNTWASYKIRKIAGCACARNAENVLPHCRFQRKPLVSDPAMHHGTCVTHVPWCMSGSLTCGDGENVPGIPGSCAPAILRIWQEAHWAHYIYITC